MSASTKSKRQTLRELNARLNVEVVDLDTEVQYFLKIIKELRLQLLEKMAEAQGDIKVMSAATETLQQLMAMLDKGVSMEIKLEKNKALRKKKLTPAEYLDGAARYILGQATGVRNAWLKDVCSKHLAIRNLETRASAASSSLEAVLNENSDFGESLGDLELSPLLEDSTQSGEAPADGTDDGN